MSKNFSIGQFKTEVSQCTRFRLARSAPLEPLKISATFDQIAVCISGSPYVAFKSDSAEACLKHIVSIKKGPKKESGLYIFTCNDFSLSNTPTTMDYQVECS